MSTLEDRIYGCLLGGLIGDAMGAPTEGKTYQQIAETYGPQGVTDFSGVGTDDTAIREQLIDAILKSGGDVTCDHFAQSFIDHRRRNYRLWFIPVRNAFHKFEAGLRLPAYAGWDNMQSSSTAMSISPMGIINACDPRRAVLETLDVASLIHNGASGFCRDAACAMAAAVAAAFLPDATPDTVIEAATAYLLPVSAREIRGRIEETLALAGETGGGHTSRSARPTTPAISIPRPPTRGRRCRPPWPCSASPGGTPSGPSCTGPTSGATRTPSPPWSGGWRAPCTACRGCRRAG